MKRIEQEMYNDRSRSVVGHVDVPDDAVLTTQPLSGQMAWAMNSGEPELIDDWTRDPISRVLDSLWGSALDSQAEDYVDDEGNVGLLDEEGYIRKKTNAMRRAREELDRLYSEKR